jgi:hypothetical protein
MGFCELIVESDVDIVSFREALTELARAHVCTGIPDADAMRHWHPNPLFCDSPRSPVRFLPFSSIWRLIDFVPFDGEDFACAVTRSFLYRAPTDGEILQVTKNTRPLEKMLLLLEAANVSRQGPRRVRLRGLAVGKWLFGLMTFGERARLSFVTKQAKSLLKRYAAYHFERLATTMVQQRLIYATLDRLDVLEEMLVCHRK